MKIKNVTLGIDMSPVTQANILLYGKKRTPPYSLILKEGAIEGFCTISVMCGRCHLGYLPHEVALDVAKYIYTGRRCTARFVRLDKLPEDYSSITVNIHGHRGLSKMERRRRKTMSKKSQKRLLDRIRAKEQWYSRYSRKWY